jgi:glyoxylase-like metal-dependent hydrolase (beta-lactamase superfamily II)
MKPITGVSVLSTGSVQIRPEHVESNGTPLLWWLATSRHWTAPRPINVYVIEHERGLVLFDTGQDLRSVTDADYYPGGIVGGAYRRLAKFEIPESNTLTACLAALGYDIADVTVAILSHLHQDHIGGLSELSHATIITSDRDWADIGKRSAVLDGVMRQHIDLPGLTWQRVIPKPLGNPAIAPFTTGHDVFDDGSMILVPTPGHTPGSLSLLAMQDDLPPMLFVGDLTYDADLLKAGRVPGVGKRAGLRTSTALVNEFAARHGDLVVLAAHDPGAAARVRALPIGRSL